MFSIRNSYTVMFSFTSFIDHLAVMFGEELPPWDTDRKYNPQNLQVCLFFFFKLMLTHDKYTQK